MFQLNELQHDTLVELFNQGVGRAANVLSQIVNEKIALSVQSVLFQTRIDVARALGSTESRRLCAVTQHYQGPFSSKAILMFTKDKSLEIVRLMVWESVTMEELSEMEEEAIGEIGNIILNACASKLADVARQDLQGSLPEFRLGVGDRLLGDSGDQWSGAVLTLKFDLHIEKHVIGGYVAFLLDTKAICDFQDYLDHYSIGQPS